MFKIRYYRERLGYTQQQVADYLGIIRQRYANWENETREINLSDACLLCDLFNCTLDELAGRTWPPKQTPVLSSADPLAGIPQDEFDLLTAYRSTDDRGRETIQAIASAQPGEESILPAYKVG